MKKTAVTTNPGSLSGFDLIQLFFPKTSRLYSSQIGTLIQKQPATIRNEISAGKFAIPHHKDSDSQSAKLYFDVRDVAAYLDSHRNPVKRGRPSKASKLAAMNGGAHD